MVDTFREMNDRGHEQIVFCRDARTRLNGIIAVHSTVLGPALGGTRVWGVRNNRCGPDRRAAAQPGHDL